MPGLAILVVTTLPGTATAGEDVEPIPSQPRPVVQVLGVDLEDGRGGGDHHLLVHQGLFLGTNFAAVQRIFSPGVLAETGGERRTLLFITMHS